MSSTAATPTSTKGLDPKAAQEALAFLRRAIEKMKSMQAAERVIASVERAILNQVPGKFDVKPLVAAINSLNLALREGIGANIIVAQATVSSELETTLNNLISRDAQLQPYHLRRFCDQSDALIDLNSFAALTSFYRSLPHTETTSGKYDLVVTRLFTVAIPGRSIRHRHLRITRDQLAKRLTEMCSAWGETIVATSEGDAQLMAINSAFDELIAEAKQVSSLEEIVSKNFFQRVRDFKASLSDKLFLPEVTAASVESNTIITNRFLILIELEGAEIRQEPEEIQLLTDIFSDTYSNQPSEMSRVLTDLQTSLPKFDVATQDRVQLYTRLLQLAVEKDTALPLPEPTTPEMFVVEIETPPELPVSPTFAAITESEEPPLSAELQAFAAQPQYQLLIEAFLQSSVEVQKLPLSPFLSPLPDGKSEAFRGEIDLRRKSLEVMLHADRVVRTELAKDCEPKDSIEERLEQLFVCLEQMGDQARELMQEARKLEQDNNYEVFLLVYNQLMSARLRLQSAIVRRTASELVEQEPHPQQGQIKQMVREAMQENAQYAAAATAQNTTASKLPVNKWFLIACVSLIVIMIGIRFTFTGSDQKLQDDSTVVILSRDQVPNGELFQEVKLNHDLMICKASGKWATLSAKEQKEKSRALFEFAKEKGVQTIMMIDENGNTTGVLTESSVNTE